MINQQINLMKNFIKKNLIGSRALILFILSTAVYIFMLVVTIPEVVNYSGGMKLLDMMPTGYNSDYVNLLFEALGEQGRYAYLFHQIPVDMIYPLLFGISNCLVLAWILNKLGKFHSLLFNLCLLPVFAGVFDYCENFGIISLLKSYPHNPAYLSQITNVFTVLKSFFTSLYFGVLIITLIVFAINRIFRKAG
jgi:hypothetical protein